MLHCRDTRSFRAENVRRHRCFRSISRVGRLTARAMRMLGIKHCLLVQKVFYHRLPSLVVFSGQAALHRANTHLLY